MKPRLWLVGLFLGVFYAIVCLATTHNYAVGADDAYNYFRGERIFQYFLTGDKKILDWWTDYEAYTPYELGNHPRFAKKHPDFVGVPGVNLDAGYYNSFGYIASAASCYVFYRKLGITDAATAHRFSNIFFGALLVAVIFWFAAEAVNPVAGFFSALAIILYPRLFVLVQNSIKDIPVLSMYVLTVWSGWRAVERENWRRLLFSAVALGLAVGCKSTGGFALLILLIYFLVRQIRLKKLPGRKFLLAFVLCPLITYALIYASNPNYWPALKALEIQQTIAQNQKPTLPKKELSNIFTYLLDEFKRATSPSSVHAHWTGASMPGWTTIRARYAFYVTPVITSLLALFGIIACFKRFFKNEYEYYLILIVWLLIPLLRTAMPYSVAYGGIRLYLDYVPALCLLAGLGAAALVNWFQLKFSAPTWAKYLLLFCYLPITYKMIATHPYQTAYFNCLIGGNRGAMEKHYPATGDTSGTTYVEALKWFNKNAEKNAKIIAVNSHSLKNFGLRNDLEVTYRDREIPSGRAVYFLITPVTWSYENDIIWPEKNRTLVKKITVDNSPLLLIYKYKPN